MPQSDHMQAQLTAAQLVHSQLTAERESLLTQQAGLNAAINAGQACLEKLNADLVSTVGGVKPERSQCHWQ